MEKYKFDTFVTMIAPYIKCRDTTMREALTVTEKLAVTLRYLVMGRSFEDLKYSALMGPRTISYPIVGTCEALICVFKDYMKVSTNYYTNVARTIELKVYFEHFYYTFNESKKLLEKSNYCL